VTQFQRASAIWFAAFMAIFAGANLAGLLLHGSKVRGLGFPFPIVRWIEIGEWRGQLEFYPSSIFINAFICATVSAMLAIVCGSSRARHNARAKGRLPGLPSCSGESSGACKATPCESDTRLP
jgi:ABC-type Fe3+ transport system permease subunit